MITLLPFFLIFIACTSIIAMNKDITVTYPGLIISKTSDGAGSVRGQETKQFPHGTKCIDIKIALETITGISRHDQMLFSGNKLLRAYDEALSDVAMYMMKLEKK